MKNICEKSGITKEAKTQLNSCLIILARNIANSSRQITLNNKKKTVSKNDIVTVLKLVLVEDLYTKSIEEGEKAVYNYVVNQKKAKSSRQQKAQIISKEPFRRYQGPNRSPAFPVAHRGHGPDESPAYRPLAWHPTH